MTLRKPGHFEAFIRAKVWCCGVCVQTSWGGTPRVIVLKSTFWYDSIQGRTKKIPRRDRCVRQG